MSDRLQRLAEDRAARNAARGLFEARLKALIDDFESRGIGERIAERASREVREIAGQALLVAKDSKGVIAGTAAALLLWFFRAPLVAWVTSIFGDQAEVQADSLEDGETSGDSV